MRVSMGKGKKEDEEGRGPPKAIFIPFTLSRRKNGAIFESIFFLRKSSNGEKNLNNCIFIKGIHGLFLFLPLYAESITAKKFVSLVTSMGKNPNAEILY